MRIAALLWLLSAAALTAEPLDTQSAFDGYTKGKTLYFKRLDGRGVFAGETYLPGNRVQWFTRDGTCVEGHWYVENRLICFVYEHNPTPQCWETRLEAGGLVANLIDVQPPIPIYESRPEGEAFHCLGPSVGA